MLEVKGRIVFLYYLKSEFLNIITICFFFLNLLYSLVFVITGAVNW